MGMGSLISLGDENACDFSLLSSDIFVSETPRVAFDAILESTEHEVSAVDGLSLLREGVVDDHIQLASQDVLRELDDVGDGQHVEVPAGASLETVADQDLVDANPHEEPVLVVEDGDVEHPLLLETPLLQEAVDFCGLLLEDHVGEVDVEDADCRRFDDLPVEVVDVVVGLDVAEQTRLYALPDLPH